MYSQGYHQQWQIINDRVECRIYSRITSPIFEMSPFMYEYSFSRLIFLLASHFISQFPSQWRRGTFMIADVSGSLLLSYLFSLFLPLPLVLCDSWHKQYPFNTNAFETGLSRRNIPVRIISCLATLQKRKMRRIDAKNVLEMKRRDS